ncbi:MAG TPA: sulfur carrier protein ThiS [Gemmatimonadota bacterium]|nr:sulfur carrier protein ThiS [Gemmatimonadota bacterium]
MSTETIRIEVNGESREVGGGSSVADLLEQLEVDGRTVVVELNRQIVRRGERDGVELEAGDRVELVRFVGGG